MGIKPWRFPVRDKASLREITAWCRANMGRSHGEISDWWVGHSQQEHDIPGLGITVSFETAVFIRNRRFAMLALLRWG